MKKSMEQVVYESLTEAIIQRKLAPGTQLIEMSIAEQLEVSRTPIRNAIKRLQQDGFVDIIPNKGAFVIRPSLEEMGQAFFIRKELELIAVREGFHKMTENDREKLWYFIEREKKALADHDIKSYTGINRAFHMVMAKATDNRFLVEYLDKILSQIDIYLLIYNALHQFNEERITGWKEHIFLVECIKSGDILEYKSLLTHHLDFSLEELKTDSQNYKPLEQLF